MKVLLAILVVCLAACSESEAPPARDEVPESNVFDPITRDPLNRAQGVEQTIFDSAAEQRRQIEEAEGR
jgi:hypothetical protein